MEAFHFKLEKVLNLRTTLAKASEQALTRKNVQINALKKQVEDKKHLRLQIRNNKSGSNKTIEDMRLEAEYEARILVELQKINMQIEVLEYEKISLQKDYLEKTKQKRVLEQLKEKDQVAYKVKQTRYHQKVMDDLVASRFTIK